MPQSPLHRSTSAAQLFSGGLPSCHYPCNPRRFFSKTTYQWISRLRFGTDEGIFFGAPVDAVDEAAKNTRKLYCRALVYASGGSTMARDWIAGCSALLTSDDALLSIALQYMAEADDLAIFRNHILEHLLQEDGQGGTISSGSGSCDDQGSNASRAGGSTALLERQRSVSADPGVPSVTEAEVGSEVSKEQIRKVENYVLQASSTVRCFLYDSMTASLFKCHGELSIIEEARRRAFHLNAQYFGVSIEDLTAIWRLVEAEFILKEEKSQILGQPWGD
ncbi:unnamed protein product [Phytomonas sp. EM1]|nr:unnamed protein product [Phytomonas sp. EM1]|eukprot:CCW64057.1 unnamed protein product [Phytomonas sp. isolate EM1]